MPVTNFVWDKLSANVLSEVDDGGVTTAKYANEPGQFGKLLSQTRSGSTSFFHFDGQGSTRQITNESQTETDNYTYTAFGEKITSSGSTTNPFQYNGAVGYYTDTETSEVYVRRRTYSPLIARWLSIDPVVFADGPNNYAYVRNHPTSYVDPSGLMCQPPRQVGASHVPGRGSFIDGPTGGWPYDPLDPGPYEGPRLNPDTTIEPMWIDAVWESNPAAFKDEDNCCCCEEIGFSQIIKSKLVLKGYFDEDHSWKLDPGPGIAYPGGSVEDGVCDIPQFIGMTDQPSRRRWGIGGFIKLISWKASFETCVYCRRGLEGPKEFSLVTDSGVWYGNGIGIVVYDCFSWGFSVKLDGASGNHVVDSYGPTVSPPTTWAWKQALSKFTMSDDYPPWL